MITVQKALRNKLISTSEPSSIRKASRARGKRIHRTCITWVQRNNSTCASNHTSISRLRGFRRSRDTLAPSWYAGGSSWKTSYMVLMNLAGLKPAATSPMPARPPPTYSTACCGQPYSSRTRPDYCTAVVTLLEVASLCHPHHISGLPRQLETLLP
jgi:hypothetical protein